ncbi:MAG: serine hydrolase domain-containing protein [Verrucomicrobiota bacterium]
MTLETFTQTLYQFNEGIEKGLHLGGQLVVIHRGNLCMNQAFGLTAPDGDRCTTEHVFLWMSSGKPVTAVAIAQLIQIGLLNYQTKVAEIIPEFGGGGKEAVTVGHILSQSAALRGADVIEAATREEILEQIYTLRLDAGQVPGQHAGYHVGGTWLVLGEIILRLTGSKIEDYLREHIFGPLGMDQSSLGKPEHEDPQRFVTMYDTYGSQASVHPLYGTAAAVQMPRPGRNIRGPVCELAWFYAALRLVLRGESDFLRREALEEMILPQRPAGMKDLTFGHPADFGYGFYLHPDKYGKGKSTYGYGQYASESSFGHSGAQSSCAFYDPAADVIVAWVVNGMPGEPRHQRRARAINEAVYRDLQNL